MKVIKWNLVEVIVHPRYTEFEVEVLFQSNLTATGFGTSLDEALSEAAELAAYTFAENKE